MSNFENDLKGEQLIAEYLDLYFYPNCIIDFKERVVDFDLQYKGIDVLADFKGIEMKIDEKAALRYSRIGELKTFSMELSFLNTSNSVKKGWLVSKEKDTSHYLLCWLERNPNKNIKDLLLEDIYIIEVMLINRIKLLKYIESTYDLTPKDLLDKAEEMRTNNEKLVKLNGKTRIFMSNHLSEKPVNLLIDRKELRSIATVNEFVRPS